MDVPGDKQSFNFTETSAKYQINNSFAPVNGGANNLILTESKNSYNGGFRWKHTTVYNASPSASPGTYKLFRFINNGSEVETEIFSIDGSGNIIFNNNVTVSGTFAPTILTIPSTIDVTGTTQTFQYSGNHTSKFVLKNLFAATVGNPSYVNLDFTNSTTGGYRFIHTSQSTDTAGIGQFKLQVYNSSAVVGDVFIVSIDGGGTPIFDLYGTFKSHGTTEFNIGAVGTCVFHVCPTIPSPSSGTHAANKDYVDSVAGNVSSLINVSGSTQTFSFATGTQTDQFIIKNTYPPTPGNSSFNSLVLKNSHNAGYELKQSTVNGLYDDIGLFYFSIFNPASSIDSVIWSVVPTGSGTATMAFPADIAMQYGCTDIQFTEPTGTFECAPAANFLGTVSVITPTLGTHAANKNYVDSVAGQLSNPLSLEDSLTFNWSYVAGSNPSLYQFTNTFTDSQQDKKYRYRVLTSDTSAGREWSIDYTLIGNSDLNGIFEIKYGASPLSTFTPFKIEVYPFADTHITFNGRSTFNGQVTFTGSPVAAVVNLATYDFTLNNTHASGVTQYVISDTTAVLKLGHNNSTDLTYVDSIGKPFQIRISGTSYVHVTTSGYVTIGATSNTVAKLLISGGVANVASEDSCIRVTGNSNATKIELENTSASGKLFELTSKNDGSFNIVDRTGGASRFSIDTNGLATISSGAVIRGSKTNSPASGGVYIGEGGANDFAIELCANSGSTNSYIDFTQPGVDYKGRILYQHSSNSFAISTNGTNALTINSSQNSIFAGNVAIGGASANAPLQFTNTATSRKIVLNEASNNDHQFIGLGADSNVFRFQVSSSGTHYIFYAGASSSTSTEIMRLTGDGKLGIGINTPNAPLQLANVTANRKIVLYEGTNNDHQFYGFGVNGGTLRFQVDTTASNFIFYAATSSSASNEILRIQGTGGLKFVNTNASTLDHYADVSYSGTWSGFSSVSASKTVRAIRIGKIVTLYLQLVTGNVTSPGALSYSVNIDSQFRPASQMKFNVPVLRNNVDHVGIASITSGGSLSLLCTDTVGDQSTFPTGQSGIPLDVTVTYMVA